MSRIGWCVAGLIVMLANSGMSPDPARACTPYTIVDAPDGFRLGHGLRWAAAAVVIDQIENPEIVDVPLAVVLGIRETIVGDASIKRLLIQPTDGCHRFWYRKGDHVIAAIGRSQPYRPPFDGIQNLSVAVWVIRGGKVDSTVEVPMINGRSPTTEAQLRAWLAGLPDTATDYALRDASGRRSAIPSMIAALLAGAIGWRRMRHSREISVS